MSTRKFKINAKFARVWDSGRRDDLSLSPNFGTAQESDFGVGNPFPPYHMIFRHSRQFWRFDLFDDERLSNEESGMSEYYLRPRSSKNNNSKIVKAKPDRSRQPSKLKHRTVLNKLLQWDTEMKYIPRMSDIPTRINYHSVGVLISISNSVKKIKRPQFKVSSILIINEEC